MSPLITISRRTIIAVVGAGVVLVLGWYIYPNARLAIAAERCDMRDSVAAKADCWDGILRKDMREHGVSGAYKLFKYLYRTYPDFVYGSGGCHQRAHLMGDNAYYELYLQGKTLDEIDLTQDVHWCTWGFVHGFMHHLITDHPDPAAISQTCAHFADTLTMYDRDIVLRECYHGAGHGLMQAQADKKIVRGFADMNTFLRTPFDVCETIGPDAVPPCEAGTINAFLFLYAPVLFSKDERSNIESLFNMCAGLAPRYARMCYGPIGLQLGASAHQEPRALADIVLKNVSDTQKQIDAFEGGIAAMLEERGAEHDAAGQEILHKCVGLPDHLVRACVRGLTRAEGFYASPQDARSQRQKFCSSDLVKQLGETGVCESLIRDDL